MSVRLDIHRAFYDVLVLRRWHHHIEHIPIDLLQDIVDGRRVRNIAKFSGDLVCLSEMEKKLRPRFHFPCEQVLPRDRFLYFSGKSILLREFLVRSD